MSAAVWSFYDATTGRFTGCFVTGSEHVAMGCAPGRVPVIGRYDPALWRFDLALGRVVAVEAAQQPLETVTASIKSMEAVRALEAGTQRALREVLVALAQGQAPPAQALARLVAVDQEAAARRAELPPPQ
jgi:hypothetical protein